MSEHRRATRAAYLRYFRGFGSGHVIEVDGRQAVRRGRIGTAQWRDDEVELACSDVTGDVCRQIDHMILTPSERLSAAEVGYEVGYDAVVPEHVLHRVVPGDLRQALGCYDVLVCGALNNLRRVLVCNLYNIMYLLC